MTNPLYTYGYIGNRDALKDLKRYAEAGCLIADIRMAPYSQRPDFRQGHLKKELGAAYLHLPALGNLNYQRAGKEPIQINDLSNGLHSLDALLQHQPVVILCGCKDHETCHRNIVQTELRVWQRLMGFDVSSVHHLAHGESLETTGERA